MKKGAADFITLVLLSRMKKESVKAIVTPMILNSELIRACKKGNIAMAKSLLEKGAIIDWHDEYFDTPLGCAFESGNLALVKLLLDNNEATTNLKIVKEALNYACSYNSEEIFQLLVIRNLSKFDEMTYFKSLSTACDRNYVGIVTLYIEGNLDFYSQKCVESFTNACASGSLEVIQLFIKNGLDVSNSAYAGCLKTTCTESRTNIGDVLTIKRVEHLDTECFNRHITTAKLLIENGSNLNELSSCAVPEEISKYNNGLNPYAISSLPTDEATQKTNQYFDLYKEDKTAKKDALLAFIRFTHRKNKKELCDFARKLFLEEYSENISELPLRILPIALQMRKAMGEKTVVEVFSNKQYAGYDITIGSSRFFVNRAMAFREDLKGLSKFLEYSSTQEANRSP